MTLRRILSHNAGLTVHGFPGYEAGAPIPTVPQILDGVKPANTAPVRVDTTPGAISRRAAALAGTYRLRAGLSNNLLATVTLENGKLFLAAKGALEKTELFVESDSSFFANPGSFPVAFSRSATGRGVVMTVFGDWSGPKIK